MDTVLVNTVVFPDVLPARDAGEGARPVEPNLDTVRALVPRVLTRSFASAKTVIRHDAERVLLALWPELGA